MSSNSKTDPRVKRTKAWLTEALFELMKKHAYAEINITMITKKAGVNRQTFYLHFKTKEDILHEYIQTIFERFQEEMVFEKSLSDLDEGMAVRFFEVLAGHFDWLRLLKHDHFFPLVLSQIQANIRLILEQFCRRFGAPVCSQTMFDYTAEYVAGAAAMLTRRWIDNGMDYTPDQIGRIFHELTLPVLQKALYDNQQINI